MIADGVGAQTDIFRASIEFQVATVRMTWSRVPMSRQNENHIRLGRHVFGELLDMLNHLTFPTHVHDCRQGLVDINHLSSIIGENRGLHPILTPEKPGECRGISIRRSTICPECDYEQLCFESIQWYREIIDCLVDGPHGFLSIVWYPMTSSP